MAIVTAVVMDELSQIDGNEKIMTRTQTIQTRIEPDIYTILQRICELKGQTISEYLRNSLRDTLEGEKEMYKMMLKKTKGRK